MILLEKMPFCKEKSQIFENCLALLESFKIKADEFPDSLIDKMYAISSTDCNTILCMNVVYLRF